MTRTIAELAAEFEDARHAFMTSELDVDDLAFLELSNNVYQLALAILERIPSTPAEAAAQLRVILDHEDWGVDQVAPTLVRIEAMLRVGEVDAG